MHADHAELQSMQHPSYKDLVEQKFKARSADYDEKGNYHYKVASELVARAGLQPGWQVLDVACGTGLATYLAASAVGRTGSVTGVDLSAGTIDKVHHCSTHALLLLKDGGHHKPIYKTDCRQRPNCVFQLVPMFPFWWRM